MTRYRRWPSYQAATLDAETRAILLRAYQDVARDEIFDQMNAGTVDPHTALMALTVLAEKRP